MRRAVLRLRAILIAGLISITPLISATAASMEDAIIVYGGVGNLGRDAQPCLAMLYEGGKKFLPYTDKINNSIRKALSGITLFPEKKSVIVGAEQLNAAIKNSGIEFDRRPSQIQIKEFLEDNEGNIFALSIVGGSELYVNYTLRFRDGPAYHDFIVANVSALITQISGDNAGQVVLTATSVVETTALDREGYIAQGEVGCENSDTISEKWLKAVSSLYARAAVKAINVLAKQKQTAGEDTTSVIVMGVSVESLKGKELFGTVKTDLNSIKSICEIPIPCADDDKRCKGLIGSMAFALTETFSKRGFLAIPPLNWGAWGKSGQYQVAKNLKLTGARSDILPFVQINVGPNAADRKLHSTVTKFIEKDVPYKKSKVRADRYFVSFMKHRWEETEFENCKNVDERGEYPETRGLYKFKRNIGEDKNRIKEGVAVVPIGRRVASATAAILKSVWALEKKIELD